MQSWACTPGALLNTMKTSNTVLDLVEALNRG